jgi:hypothetical protein
MINKTSKVVLFFFLLLIPPKIFSIDFREIIITYEHSRRVLYNTIIINIKNDKISVKVTAMEGKENNSDVNFEKEIIITQEYFNTIYQKFSEIDYYTIVDKSRDIHGLDGETINISIGTPQNKMEIELWSINYMKNERNTTILLKLIKEIFSIFNLENYIFQE